MEVFKTTHTYRPLSWVVLYANKYTLLICSFIYVLDNVNVTSSVLHRSLDYSSSLHIIAGREAAGIIISLCHTNTILKQLQWRGTGYSAVNCMIQVLYILYNEPTWKYQIGWFENKNSCIDFYIELQLEFSLTHSKLATIEFLCK